MSDDTQQEDAPPVSAAPPPPPMAIVPPPAPAAPSEPPPSATFDAIVAGDEDGEAPSTDGLVVLAELGSPKTAGAGSATDSYGYDRDLAFNGKWFRWPKLGPTARVKLCKIGSPGWKVVADRARQKYGDEGGAIAPAVMEKILKPMMAKAAFVEMEGVVVELGADPLKDSEEGRLRLLEMFDPELPNDLWKVCNNPRQFKDASEEVLGN